MDGFDELQKVLAAKDKLLEARAQVTADQGLADAAKVDYDTETVTHQALFAKYKVAGAVVDSSRHAADQALVNYTTAEQAYNTAVNTPAINQT